MVESMTKQKQYKLHIQKMEEREQELVDRLKATTQTQTQAYRKLESVVNSGYQYYMQALDEKKKMQTNSPV